MYTHLLHTYSFLGRNHTSGSTGMGCRGGRESHIPLHSFETFKIFFNPCASTIYPKKLIKILKNAKYKNLKRNKHFHLKKYKQSFCLFSEWFLSSHQNVSLPPAFGVRTSVRATHGVSLSGALLSAMRDPMCDKLRGDFSMRHTGCRV